MEYKVLCSYWRRFHEDRKQNFIEICNKIDNKEIGLLFGISIPAIIAIIICIKGFQYTNSEACTIFMFISLFVEYVFVMLLKNYEKEKEIKNTKENIEKLQCHYVEVYHWLSELGYSNKKQIESFAFRCEKKLEGQQSEIRENKQYGENVLLLFYVPMLLAIISWILDSNKELEDMGIYILLICLITTLGVAIYLLIVSGYEIWKHTYMGLAQKMKQMLEDIYGVIDYCFKFENVRDENIVILKDKTLLKEATNSRGESKKEESSSNPIILSPEKMTYLQMIQEPICRMSTISAIFKGFAATIVAGIAALTYCEVNTWILGLSFIPVLLFACLDVYYLKLEKKYRYLYEQVRIGKQEADFSMKLTRDNRITKARIWDCIKSPSILLFYPAMITILSIVFWLKMKGVI